MAGIIREYVCSAQPVGSKFLASNFGFKVSPATIRNEMSDLENEGYICQPHTSAGRVPTASGYRFYIEHFLQPRELSRREEKGFRKIKKAGENPEAFLKETARLLAEFSAEAAIVGFGPKDVFYTGLSNLFSQPEFKEAGSVCRISEVLDHLDWVVEKLFSRLDGEVKVLVGGENPFGESCGAVFSRYDLDGLPAGMFGILGPLRMDYERNVSLVKYVKNMISGN